MESALVWGGVVLIGLTLASWAKYVMDRNTAEERTPRIVPPVVLTVLLVVVFTGVSFLSEG